MIEMSFESNFEPAGGQRTGARWLFHKQGPRRLYAPADGSLGLTVWWSKMDWLYWQRDKSWQTLVDTHGILKRYKWHQAWCKLLRPQWRSEELALLGTRGVVLSKGHWGREEKAWRTIGDSKKGWTGSRDLCKKEQAWFGKSRNQIAIWPQRTYQITYMF